MFTITFSGTIYWSSTINRAAILDEVGTNSDRMQYIAEACRQLADAVSKALRMYSLHNGMLFYSPKTINGLMGFKKLKILGIYM